MIVSKYGFIDIASIPDIRLTSDSGRIAAGVIQSIGFLGAGVIYIRKESVMGLTTAAGLWATVGIGLAFGAGMYVLGISTTAIIMLVHLLLRIHHQKMPTQTVGVITCNLSEHGMTV
ncbi:MAG: MgtC/SapB family protein, partial [Oscillospiraceae bacterium]|nr:MgtC/SapB family protein [Oscillospiraceae bacterium]